MTFDLSVPKTSRRFSSKFKITFECPTVRLTQFHFVQAHGTEFQRTHSHSIWFMQQNTGRIELVPVSTIKFSWRNSNEKKQNTNCNALPAAIRFRKMISFLISSFFSSLRDLRSIARILIRFGWFCFCATPVTIRYATNVFGPPSRSTRFFPTQIENDDRSFFLFSFSFFVAFKRNSFQSIIDFTDEIYLFAFQHRFTCFYLIRLLTTVRWQLNWWKLTNFSDFLLGDNFSRGHNDWKAYSKSDRILTGAVKMFAVRNRNCCACVLRIAQWRCNFEWWLRGASLVDWFSWRIFRFSPSWCFFKGFTVIF